MKPMHAFADRELCRLARELAQLLRLPRNVRLASIAHERAVGAAEVLDDHRGAHAQHGVASRHGRVINSHVIGVVSTERYLSSRGGSNVRSSSPTRTTSS